MEQKVDRKNVVWDKMSKGHNIEWEIKINGHKVENIKLRMGIGNKDESNRRQMKLIVMGKKDKRK
jgi:hypothetical protein